MLSKKEQDYIWANASLYDHDWRFWSEFMGEPYLINDCLVFYDSRVLYICGFPFQKITQELTTKHIRSILDAKRNFSKAEGIRIWGRTSFGQEDSFIDGFRCIEWLDYYDSDSDMAIELEKFTYDRYIKARLARNAALNKGYKSSVKKRKYLTADHIQIITNWAEFHDISSAAASIASSIQGLIKTPRVCLIEARFKGSLVGFLVLSQPGKGIAVVLQSFALDISGRRAGDSLMVEAIKYLEEKGVIRLHLGYSATESIMAFKKKWGCTWNGPGYYYITYSSSEEMTALFIDGRFLWRDRLVGLVSQMK